MEKLLRNTAAIRQTVTHEIVRIYVNFALLRPRLVKVCDKSGARNYHFRDLQTIANDVRKAEKAFLPEMQSKITTNCDNSSGIEYKTWGLGWVHF